MATSTVENYLKAILLLSERGGPMVPMGALAESLRVTPGTVTTMAKAMASQGLIRHQPREGVQLTEKGRQSALGVLRKHRLVEAFLVQVLKMDWTEVHEEAEALEHAISDRVLDKINALLGHPESDPHGDPIPNPNCPWEAGRVEATLANCELQKPLRVRRIAEQTAAFLEFVQRSGLKPGAKVRVVSRDPAGGVVRCSLSAGREAILGLSEAAQIEVRPAA